MRKERNIIINVIKNRKINNRKLADFFARKYMEKYTAEQNNQYQKS